MVTEWAGAIGAAVVDNYNLEAVEVLPEQTVETLADVLSLVVDGYDNTDLHRLSPENELKALIHDLHSQEFHGGKVGYGGNGDP